MGTSGRDDGLTEAEIARIIREAGDDEILPPEMVPVSEAGGGVAEGFELAEELLIEHATDAPPDATDRILEDALGPEAELDRAVYGEADEEKSSEDDRD